MSLSILPEPAAFGLPSKFEEWRPEQEQAIARFTRTHSRFNAYVMPTGSGKSLVYMTAAILNGGRALVLTSTKGLQKQLHNDFGYDLNMVTVMGKNAYSCRFIPGITCDMGPCNFGMPCGYKHKGCPYYDQIRLAGKADIVLANYAFWFMHDTTDPNRVTIGDFDILIMDEAHDSPQLLLDALSFTLTHNQVIKYLRYHWPVSAVDCWDWLRGLVQNVEGELEYIREDKEQLAAVQHTREYRFKCAFATQARGVFTHGKQSDWVIEYGHDTIKFDPLWPAYFAEDMLFRGIPRVLLTSATITEKILNFLGVFDNLDLVEYPSSFPVESRPIYFVPTVRMDYKISNAGYALWLSRIDQIQAPRQDRNGIIHTVSYDRCRRICNVSDYKANFITHERDARSTNQAVQLFKHSKPPVMLVSPSVVTGFDFPFYECEYQIIGKVPFPDMRSLADQERRKIDKDYGTAYAMLNLIQACGRGMRAADDRCECFIIDDNFKWFIYKYRHFAPKWFTDAIVITDIIPKPLPKIVRL